MWQLHGSDLRRIIQDVNGADMLSYLARNQKEVLHRVNLENKSYSNKKEVSDVSDTSFILSN